MDPADVQKTAVITPFGLFEFLRMPFGLKNSAQAFQRLMDGIFRGLDFVFVYLDDILIASPDHHAHANHLHQVFGRLQTAGLAINKEKSVLGETEVTFLGHRVHPDGLVPLPAKIDSISAMPQPTTKVELQRFLGCVNFYHRFLPGIAEVLAPLHALTASVPTPKATLSWQSVHVTAFHHAKARLAAAVRLTHPDPAASVALTTDASDLAVGAVLSQGPDAQPLGFFSKKLSDSEKKYSAFDRELLAMYLAVKHFRPHLDGRQFPIYTDHKPLCGAITSSVERSPRQTRHLSYVSEFTTDIRHVAGCANVVADTLSRPAPDVLNLAAVTSLPALTPDEIAAAQAANPSEIAGYREDSSLVLQQFPTSSLETVPKLWCDVSRHRPRPVIPRVLVQQLLLHWHGLNHPGGRATLRGIRERFVWARMSSDCLAFVRGCQHCQRAKVVRHAKTSWVDRPLPDARFLSLHLDLVGPLPESEGKSYLLTVIDRYSRWLEAIPLSSITATDCAKALLRHWVARFGVPVDITTDQGRQFSSTLWADLTRFLGIKALRTTSYHPQANGMVERVHRVLKERLMARSPSASDWMTNLPFVLLGIRTALRDDTGFSPAHLTYGGPLRLPGEFLAPSPVLPGSSDFVANLQTVLRTASPFPLLHNASQSVHLPADLRSCDSVFVRIDAIKRPLTPPYCGPFTVLERGPKIFVLERSGKPWTVSVDRLKPMIPAAIVSTDTTTAPSTVRPPTTCPESRPVPTSSEFPSLPSSDAYPLSSTFRTRSGRLVKRPARFQD